MDKDIENYTEKKHRSRVERNQELYKRLNEGEFDSFDVPSNATVIGSGNQDIDIESIKKILDTKYNQAPKRRSIRMDEEKDDDELSEREPTKEYDLNTVIEHAKDSLNESYETDRAKKLRNTQYDILTNLNIESKEEEKNPVKSSEEDLMELINTITLNEAKKKEDTTDPLDILTDLKGDENTEVYESMVSEVTKITSIEEKADEVIKDNQDAIDNSFYTKSNKITGKDIDDNNTDFVDNDKMSIWIKLLIILVVICFLVGLFLFLKSFLKF